MHGTLKTKLTTRCAECAKDFSAKRPDRATFCSTECRGAWNVRRRDRGAMLLDLYIHTRFNRAKASEKGLQTMIDRMIGNWVEEDRQAGRKVMRELSEVIEAAMPHTNQRFDVRAGR